MGDFEAAWLSPIADGVRVHFLGGSRDDTFDEIRLAGTYSFGRDPSSSYVFSADDPADAMVSARHAYIRVTREGVRLGRLSPANGLELFNLPAAESGETQLRDGDLIRLGRGGPRLCVRIGRLDGLDGAGKEGV